MSQALMNGPSPLTPGEREMIAAYVVGVAECDFAYVAHCEAAYAWGIEDGLIDRLLDDPESGEAKFRPLLAFVKKLTLTPGAMVQGDADAVFDAGWDEKALGDAIAVTARMCFMQRLVEGHGFIPMTRDKAKENASKRVNLGYVDLYPDFARRSVKTNA
jgi:alkylhydroperoxidase family enzyme